MCFVALHISVSGGHIELVRLLLEKGIDLNSSSRDGVTALHYACTTSQVDIVQILCEAKANLEAKG
jgi:ankyrin repeat protein